MYENHIVKVIILFFIILTCVHLFNRKCHSKLNLHLYNGMLLNEYNVKSTLNSKANYELPCIYRIVDFYNNYLRNTKKTNF